MPNTEGLELLISKKSLSEDDWVRLIEARCSLIRPHLSSFTLTKLGDVECLRTELSFTHSLRSDVSKATGDRWFSLDTQGIFCCPKSSIQRIPNSGYQAPPGGVNCPNGVMYLWGFTRDASWVLVKVKFKGEAGYKCRGYERAQEVDIQFTNLETIIAETKSTLQEIWRELGKAIKDWTKRRQLLYNKALELEQMITTEELIFSLCQKER